MFKIRQPFFNADVGADEGGDGGQQPGKTFTQEEVDAMMKNRWKEAEMTKAELNEFADTLKQFGYQGSPSEIKAALKQEAETRRKAAELKELEEEADLTGTSPELLSEIKQLKSELAEIKKDKEDQKKEKKAKEEAQESWNAQVTEFQEKYPDIDMDKLAKNEKFLNFVKKANPNVSLSEAYETYVELVGDAEKAAIAKINSNADRSTFSGKAKADPTGGTHGLTESQQKLAKENGLTFKEYSERLKDIN